MEVNVMDYLENSVFRTKAVVFDQLSFWLIIGVLVVFLAGTMFGRLTDGTNKANASAPQSMSQHHTVYGRFGSLHWK